MRNQYKDPNYHKKYCQEHKEEIAEKRKNKQKSKEYNRKYYLKHREEILDYVLDGE